MAGNSNLQDSMKQRQDEFYTQLPLIESELKHYREHFRGKVIFCNCDDPYESNFFKFFAMNFNFLGLKKLIATCFIGSPFAGEQLSLFDVVNVKEIATENRQPHKIEITEVPDMNEDGAIGLADVEILLKNKKNALTLLDGDGDFRSAECIGLLKESDIVVTNPPFSLFREYVAQLMEYEKSFIIIGNQNAVTYREIFPLLVENKIWLGYMSGHFWFMVPDSYEEKKTDFKIDENGKKWRRMGNICWFTNLDIEKRHQELTLYKKYSTEEYPNYENYEAINVNLVTDIPCDYDEVMGVPITFMDKYNPDQFTIVGATESEGKGFSKGLWLGGVAQPVVNGKRIYKRLFIKRKGVQP